MRPTSTILVLLVSIALTGLVLGKQPTDKTTPPAKVGITASIGFCVNRSLIMCANEQIKLYV